MKKNMFLCAGLCAVLAFTSCKSSESAYKKAYEKAQAKQEQPAEQPVAPVQKKCGCSSARRATCNGNNSCRQH